MNRPTLPAKKKNGRRNAETFGRLGEALAAIWMQARLYTILHRRLKTPMGEIDLIARRGNQIVFIEVKTRSSRAGQLVALGAANRGRIVNAARWWLAANPHAAVLNLRFDVIVLAPFCWPVHVKGAFDAACS